MSTELLGLVTAAVGAILFIGVAVGLPSLAVIALRFFKFKEHEMTLEMEHRRRSQEQDLAIEQRVQAIDERVQRLEEVVTSLDRDVRDRVGIAGSAETSLSSRPDLVEAPPAPDAPRDESLDPVPTKAH